LQRLLSRDITTCDDEDHVDDTQDPSTSSPHGIMLQTPARSACWNHALVDTRASVLRVRFLKFHSYIRSATEVTAV